ncbi:MAG: hypothetical protein ACYDC6_12485 [Acidobacteriaceae bacterium]
MSFAPWDEKSAQNYSHLCSEKCCFERLSRHLAPKEPENVLAPERRVDG